MFLKVEITHNAQTEIYEGDGFEEAWKAIRNAGSALADHTSANLSLPSVGLDGLVAIMRKRATDDDN